MFPDKFIELTNRVKKLLDLLENPNPGLFSWCQMYAEQMKWIVQYWKEN